MLRPRVPMYSLCQCVLIAILAMSASMLASPGTGSAQSTPGESPPEPVVVSMGIITIPDPTNSGVNNILYMTQVNLPANTIVSEHQHVGQSVLTVDEGAICFTLAAKPAGTDVHANRPPNTTPHPDCAETPDLITTCEVLPSGLSTCALEEGATLYVPEGGSVTQSGETLHTYENVDTIPAVIYIAGVMPDSGGDVGCDGSCR